MGSRRRPELVRLGLTAMSAVALWVRSTLRRRWAATIVLALLAGLTAGIVGASLQAAGRADDAVARWGRLSRSYDLVTQACPPGVQSPRSLSFAALLAQCISPEVTARFVREVIAPRPEVEAAMTVRTLVAAVFDPSARNGWGRGGVVYAFAGDDPVGIFRHVVLVSGRYADPAAAGELVIGERAAHVLGVTVGDVISLGSWHQDSIDSASSTGAAPQTTPFDSTVVGIIRADVDLQSSGGDDLTGATFPAAFYADSGWVAAHGDNFAGYGSAAAIRLAAGVDATTFADSLQRNPQGWQVAPPGPFGFNDVSVLERSVQAERQAVLIFALIGITAGMTMVGLTLARQLRRELDDASALTALGFTRSRLILAGVLRSLVIGVLATVVAAVTIVVLSPYGPLGVAGRLEYEHPIRLDWPVLLLVGLGIPLFLGAVAAGAVVFVSSTRQRSSQRALVAPPLGPVSRTAVNFARGGSPRLAVVVGAVAVAVAVAAGVVAASFDRVIDEPVRYGAWWDVVVGDYSDRAKVQAGVDQLAGNAAVTDVGGFLAGSTNAVLDGLQVPYIAIEPEVGEPTIPVASGRAPVAKDEVALGAATAEALHKGIGDTLTLTSTGDDTFRHTVEVVGIAVLNNPVSGLSNAGTGVLMQPELAVAVTGGGVSGVVAQSLVIRFDPSANRQAAIDSVVHDFGGSTRLVGPPADLRNLQRVRFVPWMVAALIGVLALASLIHALVTLLQRHAGDLAVLAALGMTTRQRRRVGPGAGLVIIAASIVVGVPAGLVLGRWVWRVVASRVFIPSGVVMPLTSTLLVPLVAVIVTATVAAAAARWVTRRSPAAQLRTE